jgi:formylglycine-generating enzyme required for sulfatase activity
VFVVALTPSAVHSRWVRDETFVAIELEKKGQVRFVPLAVEPCDVPHLWSMYQRIPFQSDYGHGLTELLDALEPDRRAQRESRERAGQREAIRQARLDTQKAEMARQERERLTTRRPATWVVVAGALLSCIAITIFACGQLVGLWNRWFGTSPTPRVTTTPKAQPTNTPGPTPMPGSTRIAEKDGMVMVYVPAGEFLMGSTNADIDAILANCKDCKRDSFADEQPQHKIYLDAFWIDRTEVTNTQYKQCVQAQKCKASSNANDASFNGDIQPVVGVDWNNAKNYCEWAGRQLPTEAQWEKAARGTDGRFYPWGNTAPNSNRLNFNRQVGKTTEVGMYLAGASPYGANDMAGNVAEWTADWYDGRYYDSSPPKNTTGPTSGQIRVLRGGSWACDTPQCVRTAERYPLEPEGRYGDVGFRCSR